jgi:hypothetical protein
MEAGGMRRVAGVAFLLVAAGISCGLGTQGGSEGEGEGEVLPPPPAADPPDGNGVQPVEGALRRGPPAPVVLATAPEQDSLHGLAVEDGWVYFTGGRQVERSDETPGPATEFQGILRRVPAGGGAVEELWTANQGSGDDVRLGTDGIYFLTYDFPWRDGRLFRLPRGGGEATVLATWSSHGSSHSLAVDGETAYWTHSSGASSSVKKTSGLDKTTTVLADEGFGSADHVVRLGDTIYFVASEEFLYAVPADGGDLSLVWQAPGMTALAGSPEEPGVLYLAAGGQLLRVRPARAMVRAIATVRFPVTAIVASCRSVYFTQVNGGVSPPVAEIWKARHRGGGARLVAGGQSRPVNLALDQSHVYWVDSDARAVVKAPR